ncbi:uncharacterized conserved protein [Hahella chejuensis KCTC 2396]|uniref:Uncharacterized conserved protein n=1 Tax=Hahella chejuensis (strain KCTC 2396) TaxID=349521 RepID=Q2SPM5_HAHCH|nr:DUF502 domain-containing protein [Hahella chejuensis]ABC27399.1 uncharacterized conserved protein [Hahella chejuensis KCTC 2396]
MTKLKLLLRNAFIGGVIVLLPLAILGLFFNWLFRAVTDLIQPITNIVIRMVSAPEVVGDMVVILVIAVACILVGSLTATSIGRFLHSRFDGHLRRIAPGYQMVKEIVTQLLGDKKNSPFRSGAVAEVKIFGPSTPTTVTAIVTSTHDDGRYTVFVPTGPNPTTGFVFHVPGEAVTLRPDIKVEAAIRTIISCGAGSAALLAIAGPGVAKTDPAVVTTNGKPVPSHPEQHKDIQL